MYHHHHHQNHNLNNQMIYETATGVEAFNLQQSMTMPHLVYQPHSNNSNNAVVQPSSQSAQLTSVSGLTTTAGTSGGPSGAANQIVYLNQLYSYPVSSTHTHFDATTTTNSYDPSQQQQQHQIIYDPNVHQTTSIFDPTSMANTTTATGTTCMAQYDQIGTQYDAVNPNYDTTHYDMHSQYDNTTQLDMQSTATTTMTMGLGASANTQNGQLNSIVCPNVCASLPPPPPPPPLALPASTTTTTATSQPPKPPSSSGLPPASAAPTNNQLTFHSQMSSQPMFTINAVGASGQSTTTTTAANGCCKSASCGVVPSIIFHIDCTTQPPSIHQETPGQPCTGGTGGTNFINNSSGVSLNCHYVNSTSCPKINIPIDLNMPYSNIDNNLPTHSQAGSSDYNLSISLVISPICRLNNLRLEVMFVFCLISHF